MWCGKDSKLNGAVGPAERGAVPWSNGLRGLVALQVLDDVCDVGDLLLEIALVLLEPAKPLFAARKAPVAAEATVVSVSVHVLTSFPCIS